MHPNSETDPQDSVSSDFAREAEQRQSSFLREYWQFLRTECSWWLVPILIALLVISVLIFVAGSSVGPFLYTIF